MVGGDDLTTAEAALARAENGKPAKLSARVRVYNTLRKQIVSLELPPGSALSENELASDLKVSRTPVRESLILLADEGLAEVFPRLGTFVARIRTEAVEQAQFIREAIELAGLERSVPLASESDIADLRALLAAQREAEVSADMDTFFELDESFHQRLLAISGHQSAWKVANTAKGHLDRVRRLSLPMPDTMADMIDQHEQVVNLVEKSDHGGAEEMLRTHLRRILHDVDDIRMRNPWCFAPPR